MSDPITALLISSATISAAGAMQQGQAQGASYDSAATANNYNAIVSRSNAKVASDQANFTEEAQRRKFRDLQGKAIAGTVENGIGLEGSALDVLRQNAANNELDALTIRYEGQQKASGLLAEAEQQDYQAAANRMNANNARAAGRMAAAAALISGGTQSYMSANKIGIYK